MLNINHKYLLVIIIIIINIFCDKSRREICRDFCVPFATDKSQVYVGFITSLEHPI
jgi:hypothetical protein